MQKARLTSDQMHLIPWLVHRYRLEHSPPQDVPWHIMGSIVAGMDSRKKALPANKQRELARLTYTKNYLLPARVAKTGTRSNPVVLD